MPLDLRHPRRRRPNSRWSTAKVLTPVPDDDYVRRTRQRAVIRWYEMRSR